MQDLFKLAAGGTLAFTLAFAIASCQAASPNKAKLGFSAVASTGATVPTSDTPAATGTTTTPGATGTGTGSGTGAGTGTGTTTPKTPPTSQLPPSNVLTPTTGGNGSAPGGGSGGGSGGSGGSSGGFSVIACPAQTFVQVERLARPAINEGLVRGNDNLNAFNSIGPSFDLLSSNAAVAAVQADATTTLMALGNTNAGDRHNTPVFGGGAVTVNALVGAVLPDVMRIDMGRVSSYGSHLGFNNTPDTGRGIVDDAIDITLNLIVPDETNAAYAGLGLTVRTDNVAYTDNYKGTTTRIHTNPSNSFPYLPAPN